MILLLSLSSSMWSQVQTNIAQLTRQEEKSKLQVQKRGVGERSKVRVFLKDNTEVKGYINQIDSDSFQVTDKKSGRVTTIAFADVKNVRGSGSKTVSVLVGVGVAAAILFGIAFAVEPRD